MSRRRGPAVWLLSVQYFVVQVVVAGGWTGSYSWSGNAISDLGNTACGRYSSRSVCSPLHDVMNASFVVLGLTMLAGAILAARQVASGAAGRVGCVLLGLAGVGTVAVGLFPENTVGGLHVGGAALPFVLGNVGIAVLGWGLGLPAGLRAFSLVAGGVGLVGLPLFLSHTYAGLGIGGMERVTAYPQDLWLIVVGTYYLTRTGSAVGRVRAGRGPERAG